MKADMSIEYNASVLANSSETICPLCNSKMTKSKTVHRHIQTIAYGPLVISEQHRWCTKGCIDPKTGKIFHSRSDDLAGLVKPGSNYGYDIECYIGREIYLNNRQAMEVHASLISLGINISIREVSHLANNFLNHLENIHFANSPVLRGVLDQAGGYVAHIDATTEKGCGGIFAVLSGWDGWVLGCGKIETENHELITPLLEKTVDAFGTPVAFVRDLSKTLHKSIEDVVDCETEKIHELVCHFHLGKDVGKDILSTEHDALLALFRKTNTRKKLQDFIKKTTNALDKKEVRVLQLAGRKAQTPPSLMVVKEFPYCAH
jgi:hypothetical protein